MVTTEDKFASFVFTVESRLYALMSRWLVRRHVSKHWKDIPDVLQRWLDTGDESLWLQAEREVHQSFEDVFDFSGFDQRSRTVLMTMEGVAEAIPSEEYQRPRHRGSEDAVYAILHNDVCADRPACETPASWGNKAQRLASAMCEAERAIFLSAQKDLAVLVIQYPLMGLEALRLPEADDRWLASEVYKIVMSHDEALVDEDGWVAGKRAHCSDLDIVMDWAGRRPCLGEVV